MIRRLPPDVAVRIAAGEVVERPASAVKELLENALDAHASRIAVTSVQGGLHSLVVEDNGTGIAPAELPLAVERYATSKISDENDLWAIRTLGFRGEALASLGAVGRLEIRSRVSNDFVGSYLRMEGGLLQGTGEVPCAPGTRVQVDELFFNVPARRKFLKSAAAELRRIAGVVRDYALAYPEVAFLLFSEGRKIFTSLGDGDRLSVLRKIWGNDPPIQSAQVRQDPVRVEAFFLPHIGGDAMRLVAFVNGRRFQDGMIRAALASVRGRGGGDWLLLVQIPPEEVDVNIHPAKVEVRFRNSASVFEAVRACAEHVTAGPGVFLPDRPAKRHREMVSEQGDLATPPLPFSRVAIPREGDSRPGFVEKPEEARFLPPETFQEEHSFDKPFEGGEGFQNSVRYLGQMAAGYLLFEDATGLILMDPHAAHERIRYEILAQERRDFCVQPLALPLMLPPSLGFRLISFQELLEDLGFVLEDREGGWVLLALPVRVGTDVVSPLDFLRRTVDLLESKVREPREALWRAWASLACVGAVKLGERLDTAEAWGLWNSLKRCGAPDACPHGRPTLLRVGTESLAHHFGR